MASNVYTSGIAGFVDGSYDWAGAAGTYKVMLVKNTYTFNVDHDLVSDGPGANECDVASYDGGFAGTSRFALDTYTTNIEDASDRFFLDANDPATWTGLETGNTLDWCIIWHPVAADTDSELIVALDMGSTSTTGGDITVQFNAADGVVIFDCTPAA